MLKTIDRNVIIKETEDKEYIQNGIIIKSSNTSNIIKKIIYENTEYFVVNEKDILAII